MKARIIRIFSAFLVVVFMVACAVGCRKSPAVDSQYSVEYVYVTESGDSANKNDQGSGDAATSGNNTSDKTDSSNKNNSGNNKNTIINNGVDYTKYKGTTVRYATWEDTKVEGDKAVFTAFEKKYGIKVDIDVIPQGSYINDIVAKINAGNAPDIFYSTFTFPNDLKCLQPIDAAKLDLSDPIWDKTVIDISTLNGKTYLVSTVGNIHSEADIVYYNKKLLNDNNITTPEEYYNAGKWTWKTLEKVMTDVKNLGPEYVGGFMDVRAILGSSGVDFYKYNDGKFSNGMGSKLTSVMTQVATWKKNGLINGIDDTKRDEFINGKVGIAIYNAWGLKKSGCWRDMNPNDIGFTYLPDIDANTKAVPTGFLRGYGLIKGSKNPVGAGIFMRYCLDVTNYDTSSLFINADAESFFFKSATIDSNKKHIYLDPGVSKVVARKAFDLYLDIVLSDPKQVSQKLSAMKNTVNSDVSKVNEMIQEQTKQYK